MSLLNAIPFDGISIGSAAWREFQQGFLAPLRTAVSDDGLIYSPVDNGFKVTPGAGLSVDISAGSGWANGLALWKDSSSNLVIAAAHATYTRYDYVVLRADFITKEARLVVRQGTPSAAPTEPALDKSAAPYYDVPLALVTVANGVSSIAASAISDRREFVNSAPGVMRMVKNVSGQTMYPGHIVAWNDWSPVEVIFTTTVADQNTAGVIASIIPNNGYGLMTVQGIGLIKLAANCGAGDAVGTSATAGAADVRHGPNYIARLLESGAAGSVVRCWVDTSRLQAPVITLTNSAQEQTTLDNYNYVNGLSTTFTMRRPGRVMMTFRGRLSQNTHLGLSDYALKLDAEVMHVYRFLWQEQNATHTFVHVFGAVNAGTHTGGIQWKKTNNPDPTVAYMHGNVLTSTLQIISL